MNLGLTGMPGFWGPHPASRANAAIAKRMDLFKSSSEPLKLTRHDSTAAGRRNVMEKQGPREQGDKGPSRRERGSKGARGRGSGMCGSGDRRYALFVRTAVGAVRERQSGWATTFGAG